MKKTLAIPDVHGTTHWKSCIDKIDEFDYIVQLGDWAGYKFIGLE